MKIFNPEKIKLSFEDPQYFVNEDKKTVTCKLSGYIRLPDSVLDGAGGGLYTSNMFDSIDVIATTRCADGDTWDLTTGQRVAESKAKKMAYQEASRRSRKFLSKSVSVLRSVMNFEEDMERLASFEIEHLGNLSL